MISKDILAEGFGRIQEEVHNAVTGLDAERLARRPGEEANSIAWLVWHLTRVQDDHVAEVAGREQVWLTDGWRERFGLDLPARATGYGHTPTDVAKVLVDSPELLTGYYDATHAVTLSYLDTLRDEDLDRVVDRRWDPPVTLGVRLVSVLSDDLQHAGQAALLRGLFAGG